MRLCVNIFVCVCVCTALLQQAGVVRVCEYVYVCVCVFTCLYEGNLHDAGY